jgi:hypothetical protein
MKNFKITLLMALLAISILITTISGCHSSGRYQIIDKEYNLDSVLAKLETDISIGTDQSIKAKACTLLCYYGVFKGIGTYADSIPIWDISPSLRKQGERFRRDLATGTYINSILGKSIPLLREEDLDVQEVENGNYQVFLSHSAYVSRPPSLRKRLEYGFLALRDFTEWEPDNTTGMVRLPKQREGGIWPDMIRK